MNLPIEDASNLTVRTTALGVYTCPTDRFAGRFTVRDASANPIADAWTNSYAGNFGRDVNIANNPTGGNGLFMCNLAFGVKEITDGTNQTILVGERVAILTRTPWAGAIHGLTCRITPGSPSRSMSVKTAPIEPLARADTAGGTSDNLFYDPDDFYGAHPAGLCFLMVDGSVRFVKSSISPTVYGELASRNWGEVVGADQY